MGGGAGRDDDELITGINVTPLVDVVLVLLIILMVTASYIVSHSIPMELPQGEGETGDQRPRQLTVSVDQTGQLFIDAEPVSDDRFRSEIRSYVESLPDRNESRAVIAADGRIQHSRFVYVLDSLRREGVTRYAINVRPEDLAP
jgi:biopolymer transport protein ExbD